jgi:hypothetical protein
LKLINNAEQRAYFGAQGRNFVQSKFSYQRLVNDMSAYYYRLLDQKGVDYRNRFSRPLPTNLEDSI